MQEALVAFDASAECEHRTRRYFCKRAKILGAQFFWNRRDVFSAKQVNSHGFDQLRCFRMIDHWWTADLELQFIIAAKGLCQLEGALDFIVDLALNFFIGIS